MISTIITIFLFSVLYVLGFILFRIVFKTTKWYRFYNLAALVWFILGTYKVMKYLIEADRTEVYRD